MARPLIQVALVDDHQVVTHALRTFLESFPDMKVVGIASSGEELLEKISEWPRPDVVVLDLLMPGGIDGVETTRRLMEKHQGVRVVALTASTDDARMNAVLRAGAKGYVRKEAEPELLIRAVRAVHQGRSFIDPSAAGDALLANRVPELSPREIEVLREAALGHSNREIGERLFVSEETIKTHIAHILSKLALQNRTQLVGYAVKHRLLSLEDL
jgi:two-component system, NarL family, response regulator LiaR